MTTNRFNVWPILRGHYKVQIMRGGGNADIVARVVLDVVPLLIFALAWWRSWKLTAPTPLLSGVALLTGTLLGSFTHLSTLRLKLTEADDDRYEAERDMLDETAAHLIAAVLGSAATAAAIVIGLNVDNRADGHLIGFWAAVSMALAAFVFELIIVCLPRLYSAYVTANKVPDKLSGFTRS